MSLSGNYVPGNLYANGELMVSSMRWNYFLFDLSFFSLIQDMYLFINEEENYRYDPSMTPIWQINHLKYGDWTTSGAYTKFLEFPISEVKNITQINRDRFFFHTVECEK